jgi:hypothetical protein
MPVRFSVFFCYSLLWFFLLLTSNNAPSCYSLYLFKPTASASLVSLLCSLSQACLNVAKELLEKRLMMALASNYSKVVNSLKETSQKAAPTKFSESSEVGGRNTLVQHINQLFDLTLKRRQVFLTPLYYN